MPRPRQDPQERFWSHVNKTETCWRWVGTRSRIGYGRFYLDKAMHYAHRVAYAWHTEQEIPAGYAVSARCGEPCCVRPDHLELITKSENMLRSRMKAYGKLGLWAIE